MWKNVKGNYNLSIFFSIDYNELFTKQKKNQMIITNNRTTFRQNNNNLNRLGKKIFSSD